MLLKRDIVATALVAVAGVLYGLWAVDSAPWKMSTRVTGIVVLVLGFAASASAVVPGFERLLHGSRAYLAVTSLLGLAAFAGGLWMLITSSEAGLGLLVGTMGLLWLISTVHHSLLAGARTAEVTDGVATLHTASPSGERKKVA